MSKIKALLFDFNGVVIDAEKPWFEAWRDIHARHGVALSVQQWARLPDTDRWPDQVLCDVTTHRATHAEWQEATSAAEAEIARLQVLSGVQRLLEEARQHNVITALITNSSEHWIRRWAPPFLDTHFDIRRTRGQQDAGKPDGLMHLGLLRYLGIRPFEAVGIEDSERGVRALQSVGIPSLYVPGFVTKHVELDAVRVDSLGEVTLSTLEDMFAPLAMAPELAL